jgi:hypothetical protein
LKGLSSLMTAAAGCRLYCVHEKCTHPFSTEGLPPDTTCYLALRALLRVAERHSCELRKTGTTRNTRGLPIHAIHLYRTDERLRLPNSLPGAQPRGPVSTLLKRPSSTFAPESQL